MFAIIGKYMSNTLDKNNKMQLRTISKIIEKENKQAEQIYKVLLLALKNAGKKRPVYQHILGIYFIDLLKFFTGISYRQNEYEQNPLLSAEDYQSVSTSWPYLLMHEIKSGFELDQFKWGHDFNNLSALTKKKVLAKFLAFSNFIRGGAKGTLAITEGAMTLDRFKIAFRRRINFDLIAINKFGKIPIDDLDKQLNDLDLVIAVILNIMRYPIDFETACTILHNHIKANCMSGTSPRISSADVLVAGSGCAIDNRLLAYMARHHGMRVVNIFHGGSYGVQSKPTFNQGEKLMATDLAVFGQIQDLPGEENIAFINGRYEKIRPITKTRKICLPKIGDRLMYVPTSLRNDNKRFGPYEDMSDVQYVKLWGMMRKIFGTDLIIKLHPKNNANTYVDMPIITENFEFCLNSADTFIFDYVSTAFTIATATDKPIIYLDYGLQNFTDQGIKNIKSRCIYYDMRLDLPYAFEDVVEKAKTMTFNHDYIRNFVAADGQETIDEAVFSALLR